MVYEKPTAGGNHFFFYYYDRTQTKTARPLLADIKEGLTCMLRTRE